MRIRRDEAVTQAYDKKIGIAAPHVLKAAACQILLAGKVTVLHDAFVAERFPDRLAFIGQIVQCR